ncbi:MAG TPA: DUF4260 domain-containing protein [Flavobacteriales bacterium]|nr:DUF4260 domain-containing protein [Flavobacteriales bacterium]
MKILLKLEELAQLGVCIGTLVMHGVPWWMYLLLAIGPDIGMPGYLAGPRTGAFTYNLFHHKGIALALATLGAFGWMPVALVAGVVLYGHSGLDRLFGFGLKYGDSFHNTHLGWIGKPKANV